MIIHYFHLMGKKQYYSKCQMIKKEKIHTKKSFKQKNFFKKKLFSSFLRLLISLRNQYFLFIWRIKGSLIFF